MAEHPIASEPEAAGRVAASVTEAEVDVRPNEAARLEASHELARAWSRSVIDVEFPLGERTVRLDTATEAERGADEIYTVHGRIGEGEFAFELTRPLFDSIVAELPGEADPTVLEPGDAALVLEHALTDALDALEKEIGEPAQVVDLVPGPLVTELEPLAVVVWLDKQRRAVRATLSHPAHMRILLEWLGPMEMGAEFDAGAETRVEVGPLLIGLDDLDALEPGDALAIGTEPGKNLKGRLVRPTGRVLPVTIDTAQVVISGAPSDLAEGPRGDGSVALGACIGTVKLSPAHLKRAREGGRFLMERNADNACALYDGHEVVARGELTLIDGQLGIEVKSLGAGPAPYGKAAPATAPGTVPAPVPAPMASPPIDAPDDGMDDDEVDLSQYAEGDVAVATRAPARPLAGASRPDIRVSSGGRSR